MHYFASKNSSISFAHIKVLLVAVVIVTCNSFVLGQAFSNLQPDKEISQYLIRNWTKANGLGTESINALLQSKDGYVWLGTFEGLKRFDGKRFVTFNKQNTPALLSKSIHSLAQDTQQRIWIGTHHGLTCYENGVFVRKKALESLDLSMIEALFADKHGALWIGTRDNEVYRFYENKLEKTKGFENHKDALIKDFVELPDGSIWIATDKSDIFRIGSDGEAKHQVRLPKMGGIRGLSFLNDTLWVAAGTGIYAYNSGIPTVIPATKGKQFNQIIFDQNGFLWGASLEGLWRFSADRQQWSIFHEENGLPNNVIESICFDREGNLWLGTYRNGLMLLTDGLFTVFSVHEGLPSNTITGIVKYNNAILFGSENGKISQLKDGKITKFNLDQKSIPKSRLKHLFVDSKNRLWISTYGGLLLKDGTNERLFSVATGFPDNDIRQAIEGENGIIWVATKQSGVIRIDTNGEIQTFGIREGLPSNYVMSISLGKNNELIVSTMNGICILQNDSVARTITTENGLPSNFNFQSYSDGEYLWVASNDGIWRIKGDSIRVVGAKDGLPTESVYSIVEDEFGRFWIPTNNSILRITKEKLNKYLSGENKRIDIEVFGRTDGLKSSSCIGAVLPYWQEDGTLWVPTVGGVAKVLSATEKEKYFELSSFVESVKADSISIMPSDRMEIPPGTSRLRFEFTALHFRKADKLRFRYKLVPFDKNWHSIDDKREALYTNMSPADYQFQVQVTNADVWPENYSELSLKVLPMWWQAGWFKFVVAAAVILVLFSIYRVRIYSIQQKQKLLEELVRQRTVEVEQQKEELKAQAENLRSTNSELIATNEHVEQQKDIIEKTNAQMTSSIRYAKSIQNAILPMPSIINEYFEHFIIYKPKDIVSGDFYWFTQPLHSENGKRHIFSAVVDCTGHGVPGGFMSMIGHQLLNVLVFDKHLRECDQILEQLHHEVHALLHHENSDSRDGMELGLCRIELDYNNSKTINVQYAGAKRPLMYTTDKELFVIKGTSRGIGPISRKVTQVPFQNHNLKIARNSVLYMSSDGFIHQPNNDRKSLGSKTLHEKIVEIANYPMEEKKKELLEILTKHQGQQEQRDDISLLALKL